MSSFAISADIRAKDEKVASLKLSKKFPGVVYGKTQEAISLTLNSSDFLRLYRKAGESNIIELTVGKKKLEVLVHSTQKHPVTGDFTHVDFYAITRGESVQTKISLSFVGESDAVKQGAIIEEMIKEVEVKCLPRNLVDHFDVNLSKLVEAGDMIRVSDLAIDTEKYELLSSSEDVVASATLPRAAVAADDEVSEEGAGGSTEEAEGTPGE